MEKNIFAKTIEESLKRKSTTSIKESKVKKMEEDEYLDVVDVDMDPDLDDTEVVNDPDVDVIIDPEIKPDEDTHVGQYVYQCDLCGVAFFSDEMLGDEDNCPICGDDSHATLVGVVTSVDDPETDPEEEPEDPEEEDPEDEIVYTDEVEFEESVASKLLTKFASENYKNIKTIKVSKVVAKPLNKLVIEAKVNYKSGKSSVTEFVIPKFDFSEGVHRFRMTESKLFNTKTPTPFIMECKVTKSKVTPTKLTYNFITESKGNKYKVFGSAK